MSDDLVERLRQPWDTDRSIMSQTGRWMTEREDAADRIEELERQKTASMREATNLAWALYHRFYQDQAPQWAPLEEVCGIISQIDNMTAGMADRIKELEAAIDWQIGRAEAAEAKLAKAMEALTPSTQTKAKFMGEFHVPLSMATDWGEETRLIPVPWTTVKEIMKAIRDFAELKEQTDE